MSLYLETPRTGTFSRGLAIIDDRAVLVGLVPWRKVELASHGLCGQFWSKSGQDLYRADDVGALCSPGLFSKSGQYVCYPCPNGWTSDEGSASCTYAQLPILLKTWIPVALTLILIGAVLSPLAGQLCLCTSRHINLGEALSKARSRHGW